MKGLKRGPLFVAVAACVQFALFGGVWIFAVPDRRDAAASAASC